MSKSTNTVRRIIAYIMAALVLVFSAVAILAIWDIIDSEDLLKRMFQSLMVLLSASAIIVLIFSLLDRPDRNEELK